MSELSILDLERETVELLPRREALGRKKNHMHGHSTAVAIAANVAVVDQEATAVAVSHGGDAFAAAGNFAWVQQEAVAIAAAG